MPSFGLNLKFLLKKQGKRSWKEGGKRNKMQHAEEESERELIRTKRLATSKSLTRILNKGYN